MPTAFDANQAVYLVLVRKLNGTVDSMALSSFRRQQQKDACRTSYQSSRTQLAAVPCQQASLQPLSWWAMIVITLVLKAGRTMD